MVKKEKSWELRGGKKLRQWRSRRNWNQTDAASYLGISLPSLSRYENGHPPPLDVANLLVVNTSGFVRYRDFYHNFHPEYA